MRLSLHFGAAVSLLLLATMAVGCTEPGSTPAPAPVASESEAVAFPDENLETAIRDALSKPSSGEITITELAKLTALEAEYSGIANISGLEYCTNLAELILYQNQISEIAPLSSLTNLTVLYLDGNPLSATSVNVYIPQLEERGVDVSW